MTRRTSYEAYQEMLASGALMGKQASAQLAVINHGPGTSAEIIKAGSLGENVNLWRARFTELQARGLIVEAGVRKCRVTGRSALVWEATDRTKPLSASKGHSAKLARRRARITEVLKNAIDHHGDLTLEEIADRVVAVL